MTKTYHHGDLRAALIEATLQMIRDDEAHLIGFRELARRLDVSRTAPYRHFESVEALLGVVAEEGYQKFVKILEIVAKKEEISNDERFIELGMAYINFALDNPAHYRLLFDQRFFTTKEFKTVKSLATQAFGLLQQTSSRCVAPEAPESEKLLLAKLAWASVHGLSSLLMDGQLSRTKNRETFIRISCEKLLSLAH